MPRPSHVLTCPSSRYFTSIFVSLGVFLFGYDQGVMSGIITYESISSLLVYQHAIPLLTLLLAVARTLSTTSITPPKPT